MRDEITLAGFLAGREQVRIMGRLYWTETVDVPEYLNLCSEVYSDSGGGGFRTHRQTLHRSAVEDWWRGAVKGLILLSNRRRELADELQDLEWLLYDPDAVKNMPPGTYARMQRRFTVLNAQFAEAEALAAEGVEYYAAF